MANQYYYDILFLNTQTTNGHEKAVLGVGFHYVGTHDDGTVVRYESNIQIPEPATDSEFIEFESLQANTVLSWIESNISDAQVDKCKRIVDELIDLERNPVQPREIPWV